LKILGRKKKKPRGARLALITYIEQKNYFAALRVTSQMKKLTGKIALITGGY